MQKKTLVAILMGGLALIALAGLTVFLVNRPSQPSTRESHPADMTVKQFIKQIAPAAQAEQKNTAFRQYRDCSSWPGIGLGPG